MSIRNILGRLTGGVINKAICQPCALNASVEVGPCRVEVKNVGEKAGRAAFGEAGAAVGKWIDDHTEDVTIRIKL